ncbi:unnamed protein product [Orchesella dallaii]|uniref:Uncharacterized protein n=1 Tax=Orchesella dallaii TaxID=48710 RepID=A0ABP1RGE0_9HEXA
MGYPKTVNFLGDYCNGTALFLPDIEAIETFYELSNIRRNHGKVFISEETLFNVDYGIQFFRWVNPNVLRRMTGLTEAGFWEWWSKFFVEFMARLRGERANNINLEEGLSKTIALSGHISVVFVLHVCGLLVSSVTFGFEVMKLIGVKKLKCRGSKCMSKRKVRMKTAKDAKPTLKPSVIQGGRGGISMRVFRVTTKMRLASNCLIIKTHCSRCPKN